jgi:hypothetical protein
MMNLIIRRANNVIPMSWDRAPRKNSVHFRNVEFHRFFVGNKRINLTLFIKCFRTPESTFIERGVSVRAGHGTLIGLIVLYLGLE